MGYLQDPWRTRIEISETLVDFWINPRWICLWDLWWSSWEDRSMIYVKVATMFFKDPRFFPWFLNISKEMLVEVLVDYCLGIVHFKSSAKINYDEIPEKFCGFLVILLWIFACFFVNPILDNNVSVQNYCVNTSQYIFSKITARFLGKSLISWSRNACCQDFLKQLWYHLREAL